MPTIFDKIIKKIRAVIFHRKFNKYYCCKNQILML